MNSLIKCDWLWSFDSGEYSCHYLSCGTVFSFYKNGLCLKKNFNFYSNITFYLRAINMLQNILCVYAIIFMITGIENIFFSLMEYTVNVKHFSEIIYFLCALWCVGFFPSFFLLFFFNYLFNNVKRRRQFNFIWKCSTTTNTVSMSRTNNKNFKKFCTFSD